MQVIPAVDLLGDHAVRLERGNYDRVVAQRAIESYVADLLGLSPPMLHLVDLEAARSGKLRLELIGRVMSAAGDVPVQVSGGIRDVGVARQVLELGACRVVVGTAAFGESQMLRSLVDELGQRLVVAID